jgi:hypothetical protein
MSSEKLYSEILSEIENASTRKERVEILRREGDDRFKFFLQLIFNPAIEFDILLPHIYRPAKEPAGLNYTYLDMEMPKMYRFIKNHPMRPPEYTAERTTQALSVMLESLHADEAALILQVFKKDFKKKHLTHLLVKEAFPDLII